MVPAGTKDRAGAGVVAGALGGFLTGWAGGLADGAGFCTRSVALEVGLPDVLLCIWVPNPLGTVLAGATGGVCFTTGVDAGGSVLR